MVYLAMKLTASLSVLAFLLPFGKPANALQIIYDNFTTTQSAGTTIPFASNTIRTLGSAGPFSNQAAATINFEVADKLAVSETIVSATNFGPLLTYTFFLPQDFIGYTELQLAGLDVTSGSFNTSGLIFTLTDNFNANSVVPTISGSAGNLTATVLVDNSTFPTLNLSQIIRFSFTFNSSSSFNLTASDVQFQDAETPPETPEPSTYLLLLAGSLALFAYKCQGFKSSRAITSSKLQM